LRLNLGCGRSKVENMVNVDLAVNEPDIVLDIDNAELAAWKREFCSRWENGYQYQFPVDPPVEYAQLIHVIEHLHNPLQMMENLWHVCKDGAICYIRCPHGASDDAWEDPTHVRPYFPGSFLAFAQPYYWRADYGYRGDWQVVRCELRTPYRQFAERPDKTMLARNCIQEMVVTLRAIKPARPPERELLESFSPIVTVC
jgi:hypothetical protein